MSPSVGQSGRSGTPGLFCGLRVGMEVEGSMAVVLVMSPSVCWPGWPIGNAWVVVHSVANLRPRGVSSLSRLRVHGGRLLKGGAIIRGTKCVSQHVF
jgi:hypothetical protein